MLPPPASWPRRVKSSCAGSSSWISGPGFSEELAQRRLDAALAKLPEAERVVFVLYEMQNLSGPEIGAIVGAKPATVWRRLHYARRSLQVELGLREEDAP